MGNRPPQSTSGRNWPRDVRDLFRSTQTSRRHHNIKDSYTASDGHQHVSNIPQGQGDSSCQRSSTNGRKSWRDKLNSCPDLQGVASRGLNSKLQEQQQPSNLEIPPPTKLNYKIYRSYSELPPSNDAADSDSRGRSSRLASCADIPIVEVRVYRRSTETLATANDRRRAQSLPRGMDLRRSLGSDLAGAVCTTGSGSSGDSRCGSTSLHGSHYTDLGGGGYSRSVSRKASARSSMASIAARVSADEFPDNSTVRRKTEEFERNFTTTFVDAFKCLAPLNQLAALCVATRPDRANQAVSLLQYLESDAIPADIASTKSSANEDTREYCLTIPLSRFPQIRRLKVEDRTAVDCRLVTCQLLAEDMARRAARELSRMFEYQLSLINESVAFRLLARHAVDCILNATRRRSRILDANGLVRGVIRGRPPCVESPMFVSVFVGTRELKWNLNEIFKKPGLRRELPHVGSASGSAVESTRLVMSSSTASGITCCSMSRSSLLVGFSSDGGSSCEADRWRTETYRSPWRYFTSPKCDPMKYGYRGQIVERDYVVDGYRLNSEDESSFSEEVTIRYDDFHRVYSPLRRLVGVETLYDYCACASIENEQTTSGYQLAENTSAGTSPHFFSIADYACRWVPAESYARDEVEAVIRPIGLPLPDAILSSMTSYTPADFLTYLQEAANRKRSDGSGATADGKQVDCGVRRAAIEVTRACDELSGKLEGEFSWKTDGMVPNQRLSVGDFSKIAGKRSHCRNPGDIRTTTLV